MSHPGPDPIEIVMDGAPEPLELAPITGDIVRLIRIAGCVVVQVQADATGRFVVADVSDVLLKDRIQGRPLADLAGPVVTKGLRTWARGPRFGAPDPWVGVGVLDGAEQAGAERTVRLRFRLAPHQRLRSDAFLLVIEALPVSREGREELGFMALRAELAAARARIGRLERTETEAAEARARIANLAHELRTPLGGVTAAADLLAGRPMGRHERELVDLMQDSAGALLALLNRSLSEAVEGVAGPAQAPAVGVRLEAFDSGRLLDAVAGLWETASRRKGLAFVRRGSGFGAGWMLGDAVRLRQVLDNLLNNALKFTDRGGVALEADAVAGADGTWRWRFAVEDSGPGLDEAARTRLFERGAASGDRGGAGIGLSLVRQIVETMGGSIRAEAVASGGLRLAFDLPMAGAETPEAPETAGRIGARSC